MLLEAARSAVTAAARGLAAPDAPSLGEDVEPRGVFVSLHREGALRGCVGHLEPDRPLGELVQEMAVAAAREDGRFAPVDEAELEGLEVEVALLSALERAAPEDVVPGRDGVALRNGTHLGVFLPQVAVEQGWDRDRLLSNLCLKAGLQPAALGQPDTVIYTFRTQRITEQR